MGPKELVRLNDISKTYVVGYEEVHALSSVSLSIREGEYVAFVGASGSGKSTLMNIVGCLDTPSTGSYLLEGQDTSELNQNSLARIRGHRIGFIFQNFNLLPRATALQNVVRPLIYQGIDRATRDARAEAALGRVALGHRKDHLPNQLSGGQRQRVAIARALCSRPAILIADEPTGNLDSVTAGEILELFDSLHRDGSTIIMVTHEQSVARRCQRRISLFDGKIVGDDPV